MTLRLIPLALGVAIASAMTPAFAQQTLVVVPDPIPPVVTIVTLPVTVPITVAGAVLDALTPPPPPPVVAKY